MKEQNLYIDFFFSKINITGYSLYLSLHSLFKKFIIIKMIKIFLLYFRDYKFFRNIEKIKN